MEKEDRIVAFLPARGGSKGIPGKNIKRLNGKPLIHWVLDAALSSRVFDDIYVSTDNPEIADVASSLDSQITIFNRSPETATDYASTESAMLEFAEQIEFDYIMLLQTTSPLTQSEDIKGAVEKYIATPKVDSLLSVTPQKRFIWNRKDELLAEPVNYRPQHRPRRQEFDGFLVENGAIYITSKKLLLESGCRISGKTCLYEMSPETYFEIDDPEDWLVVEQMLKEKYKKKISQKLDKIKLFLTDVDGVLTDAGMYYSEKGDELKKFNTRDGKGIELLKKKGIEVGIITSEDTRIVADRARKLKVELLYQGVKDKKGLFEKLLKERGFNSDEVAYIGDDINDLEVLQQVGFSACPSDAMTEVKEVVDYRCTTKGGNGCVREISKLILNNYFVDGKI